MSKRRMRRTALALAGALWIAVTVVPHAAHSEDATAAAAVPAAAAEATTTDADPLAVFAHPVDPAAPDAAFVAVGKRLGSYTVLRADFRQRKQIKVLSRPLTSSGRLTYARDHGLCWATTKPFPGMLILTPTAIKQQLDDGSFSVMTARDQPMIQAFADMLLATFSGDPARLAPHFELYFRATAADTWELGLRPKEAQMKRAIDYLRLEGAAYATRVTIMERNGDTTVIDLTNSTSDPQTLTAEERTYFAH